MRFCLLVVVDVGCQGGAFYGLLLRYFECVILGLRG